MHITTEPLPRHAECRGLGGLNRSMGLRALSNHLILQLMRRAEVWHGEVGAPL